MSQAGGVPAPVDRPHQSQHPSAQPLYLHVGLPKTGTTFLQGLMANNRTRLKNAGYIYPYVRRETMFYTAVELCRQHVRWGLTPDAIDGTWQLVLDRIRGFGGAGVVSHELLAEAKPRQVARVARDTDDLDLHVVVTARDLSRQATALWQEEIKNGRRWSFEKFSRGLFDADGVQQGGGPREVRRRGRGPSRFWRSQDLASVLDRWSAAVPADRMHVVVVPRSSRDPFELWRRFAGAIGLDPHSVELEVQPRANESLGAAQAALLREVVTALDGRLGQPHYAHVVKRFFAQTQLSRIGSPAPVTPADVREQLDGVARRWVEEIRSRGYAVHGDLDELVPSTAPLPEGSRHPDDVSAEELLQGLPEVLAEMLIEIAVLRGQINGPKSLPSLQRTEDGGVEPVERAEQAADPGETSAATG